MHDAKYMVPLAKEPDEDMVRQCAWCLRLIDAHGGRITARPQPKLYKATHGMCIPCGEGWMEQVAEAQGVQVHELWAELPPEHVLLPFSEHASAADLHFK